MAEPLINSSVYPKNHITERKIVKKGKLKTTNFSGDEVQETGKIKRKEDLATRVGERPVRRACSVHEGSMLMKSRSRQAFGQRVGDIEGTQFDFAGTYSLAEEMKFNIDVTASIAIDGILTHKNTCSIVFPHACGAKRVAVEA